MKILLPTCDKYQFLVENIIFNFSKYWPEHFDVVILGHSEPKFSLPNKWSFIQLAEKSSPKDWSNELISFFDNFNDEFFINFIDDTFLTKRVNHEKICEMINLIKNTDKISKIFLSGSLIGFNQFEDTSYDASVVKILPSSPYRTSIQTAIWRTSFFKECLLPNLDPWQFELQNNHDPNHVILSFKNNFPLSFCHFCQSYAYNHKTQPVNDLTKGCFDDTLLDREDLEQIICMFLRNSFLLN